MCSAAMNEHTVKGVDNMRKTRPGQVLLSEQNIPDMVMLPEQYNISFGELTPEQNLCAAVLHDTCDVLRRGHGIKADGAQAEVRETREWFESREMDHAFTFERVCQYLRLEPGPIRRAVLGTAA